MYQNETGDDNIYLESVTTVRINEIEVYDHYIICFHSGCFSSYHCKKINEINLTEFSRYLYLQIVPVKCKQKPWNLTEFFLYFLNTGKKFYYRKFTRRNVFSGLFWKISVFYSVKNDKKTTNLPEKWGKVFIFLYPTILQGQKNYSIFPEIYSFTTITFKTQSLATSCWQAALSEIADENLGIPWFHSSAKQGLKDN